MSINYDPDLAEHLKTVKARVEWILEKYPSARNSDTLLQFIYMRVFEGIDIPYVEWEKISKLSLETVRRMRQKLQEEGKYLPTNPEVLKRRKRLAEKYRGTINLI
ncbi:MAG: hypothetical protein RXR31_02705 [Thermoproteota archaeon]|jgi:hypothetical protein